jgi:hypothetical protein
MRNNVDRLGTFLSLLGGIFILAIGVAMFRWPGWVVRLAGLERLPTIGRPPGAEASN